MFFRLVLKLGRITCYGQFDVNDIATNQADQERTGPHTQALVGNDGPTLTTCSDVQSTGLTNLTFPVMDSSQSMTEITLITKEYLLPTRMTYLQRCVIKKISAQVGDNQSVGYLWERIVRFIIRHLVSLEEHLWFGLKFTHSCTNQGDRVWPMKRTECF